MNLKEHLTIYQTQKNHLVERKFNTRTETYIFLNYFITDWWREVLTQCDMVDTTCKAATQKSHSASSTTF